jgi:hypothetical protein
LRKSLGEIRRRSSEIHDNLSVARVLEYASRTVANVIDMKPARQSKEDDVSACRYLLQGVSRSHTVPTQTLQRLRSLIVRNDRMATFGREIAAHGLTHDTDPNKSDYHTGKT